MPFQMDWKKVIKVIFSPWEVQLTQSARRDKNLFAVLTRLFFAQHVNFSGQHSPLALPLVLDLANAS